MSRTRPALQIALFASAALCAAVAAGSAGAADAQHCRPRSIGPGSALRGGTEGAACILAAFRSGCRPAEYLLSSYGIDTAATENFRVQRSGARCTVVVITTFRVIPQAAKVFPERTCTRVRKAGADVVADRCTAGTPATISLTNLR
jgi:hypothetical protein